MFIIDTSVWIHFFNNAVSPQAVFLESLLSDNQKVCINGLIEMEILQGVKNENDFHTIKEYLKDFQYFPDLGNLYLEKSVDIYRECRKKGTTVRRSVDCIIAANALLDNLIIIHHDRDFDLISQTLEEKLNVVRV